MAVVDPLAINQTVVYTGGTLTAPKGVIGAIFPGTSPSWFPNGSSGIGKRPFGSVQRNSRRAGEDLFVRFSSGSVFTVRVTGTHKAFLTNLLMKGQVGAVLQVWSERGTVYGPQFRTLNP